MLFIAIAPTWSEAYYNIISGNFFIGDQFYKEILRPISSGVASACFCSETLERMRVERKTDLLSSNLELYRASSSTFKSSEIFYRRNNGDWLIRNLEKALDRKVKCIRDCVSHGFVASDAQKYRYAIYLAMYAITLTCSDLNSSFLAPLLWALICPGSGSLQRLKVRTVLAKFDAKAEETTLKLVRSYHCRLLPHLNAPMVSQMMIRRLESNVDYMIEVPKSTSEHQTVACSPNRVTSRHAEGLDPLPRHRSF